MVDGGLKDILFYNLTPPLKQYTAYLNNPPNPDPYPSPEVNPVDIIATITLVYEGTGTVTLVVKDDDGGIAMDTIILG